MIQAFSVFLDNFCCMRNTSVYWICSQNIWFQHLLGKFLMEVLHGWRLTVRVASPWSCLIGARLGGWELIPGRTSNINLTLTWRVGWPNNLILEGRFRSPSIVFVKVECIIIIHILNRRVNHTLQLKKIVRKLQEIFGHLCTSLVDPVDPLPLGRALD